MSVEVLSVRRKLFRWFYCPHPSFLILCGIHIHTQIVKIREYCNKYTTVQYEVFTITTLEPQHILTRYTGSFSGNVPRYLFDAQVTVHRDIFL